MRKLKILLYNSGEIYTNKVTGGVRRFRELAVYLAKGNLRFNGAVVESALCCSDKQEVLSKDGLTLTYKMYKNEGRDFIFPEFQRYLMNKNILRRIRAVGYDAVIVFDVPQAIGLCLSRVTNIVLMIRKDMIGYEIINNSGRKSIGHKIKIAIQWLCEDICLRKSSVIVCQCKYDRGVLLRRHKLLAGRIKDKFVIQINNVNPTWIRSENIEERNGITADQANGHCSVSITRQHAENIRSDFKVYFIGGFDNPRKGQDIFLDAAELILDERQDISFYLIGGGDRLDEYKERYSKAGVKFLGRKDNPINELAKAGLLVVPSFADSCPNTVMEGLYCHIPVIGSNAGGIPEMLIDREALFELKPQSLKEKIIELVDDKEKMMRLVEIQARRKEQLTFDWPKAILKKALDRMVQGHEREYD